MQVSITYEDMILLAFINESVAIIVNRVTAMTPFGTFRVNWRDAASDSVKDSSASVQQLPAVFIRGLCATKLAS